jgi:hypothetical protein
VLTAIVQYFKQQYKTMKKQILSEEFRRMQKLAGIITEAAFNSDGEPLMTHNQYRDYNEPSEDEDFDNSNDDFDMKNSFIKEMKGNDIFVETFDGEEYFIRCNDERSYDFMIYFLNDEEIEIYGPEDGVKNLFGYQDAVDYTLQNKDKFYTYDESIKSRNNEMDIDFQDRKNNRAEMGGYGLG